jgi:hypothetical protein
MSVKHISKKAQRAQAVTAFEARLAEIGGCSDGSCCVVERTGMHTNGGCKCSHNGHNMRRAMWAARAFLKSVKAAQ